MPLVAAFMIFVYNIFKNLSDFYIC